MLISGVVGAAISGLGSAILMTFSEFPFWKVWGMSGVGEWQVNSVIVSKLRRRPKVIEEKNFPWLTIATHLSNGIIAGVAFRLLLPVFYVFVADARISILWDTIVYSFVLWVLFPVLGRTTFESTGGIRISNRGLLVIFSFSLRYLSGSLPSAFVRLVRFMILLDVVWAAFIGLLSAVLMTIFEYPFWKKWGMEGVAEWQLNWVMVSRLRKGWKRIREPNLPWTIASHLSHGVVAGVAFRLLLPIIFSLVPIAKVSIVLDGVVYGMVLWVFFPLLGRKTFESTGKIRITDRGLLGSLLSDIVYGFFLGLLLPLV